MDFTAQQIASFIGGTVIGDANATVHTFAKIEEATEGSLTFLSNPKYTPYIYTTQATIVLVNNDFEPEQPITATLIKTANAYESLAKLMTIYNSSQPRKAEVSSLAHVDKTARIGEGVSIAPFVYIGKDVEIGEGTVLNPHVVIYDGCKVGAHCILHAGCVIGADGFGFAPAADGYDKIPQIGNVIIEDNVEIGANTCVDRATMGSTIIHKGAKLDNLIQVAHNVVIGSNTVMAAQSGVAGSTKVGEWCMIGGGAGITGHVTIGNRVQAGAHTGITGNVKDGTTVSGYPHMEQHKFRRSYAALRNLPDMFNELYALKKEVETLRKELSAKTKE